MVSTRRATVGQGEQSVQLEYHWVGSDRAGAPVLAFLHEGLGSAGMWRDFPERLCEAGGLRGLVWSRAGYGRSTPRRQGEAWGPDFMHRQAREVLPAFLHEVGIDTRGAPPWLFGHSDGASIALIFAASYPGQAAGLVLLAPHIFVEDFTIANIEQARDAYRSTDLRARLARYHDDVDSAFWGWNDIWLNPVFRSWNIESLLPSVRCPLLAIQGCDDEYGTMAQIDGIAAAVPGTRLLKLESCRHSPHRDQPAAVIEATLAFMAEQGADVVRRDGQATRQGAAASHPRAEKRRRSAASE